MCERVGAEGENRANYAVNGGKIVDRVQQSGRLREGLRIPLGSQASGSRHAPDDPSICRSVDT